MVEVPERIAKKFLLTGIQNWGQTEAERIAAASDYIRAAGFEDIAAGHQWLNNVVNNLRRGKYEDEVEQLTAALTKGHRE